MCCGLVATFSMCAQGVIMSEEGDAAELTPRKAWKEKDGQEGGKKTSILEKTKKNVALESSLFVLVCSSFLCFNVYYWSQPRDYK